MQLSVIPSRNLPLGVFICRHSFGLTLISDLLGFSMNLRFYSLGTSAGSFGILGQERGLVAIYQGSVHLSDQKLLRRHVSLFRWSDACIVRIKHFWSSTVCASSVICLRTRCVLVAELLPLLLLCQTPNQLTRLLMPRWTISILNSMVTINTTLRYYTRLHSIVDTIAIIIIVCAIII